MAETLTATLTSLLSPVVEGAGLFLEGVEVTKAGRYSTVSVIVDLPDGEGDIDMDAVEAVTPAVSEALDAADPIKGQYTLIVTSAGAERELTTPRHYRRVVGHTVRLETTPEAGSETITATLVGVEGETLTLALDGGDAGVRSLEMSQVASAKTVIIF